MMTRPTRNERGGATIEITLLTPLLLLFLLFVVSLGRISSAYEQVNGAARDGARAASLARTTATAATSGKSATESSLQTLGASCKTDDVAVDTSSFRPGGWVAVDVTCHVDLADLSLLRVPGTKLVHARFVSPIDTFRATS